MLASSFSTATRSVIEPVGVGTRSDDAVELALELGQHAARSPCAAPVVLGMIDSAAARMRRRSGLPERVAVAWSCELLVARVRVHRRDEALLDAEARRAAPCASGARQLVVHDAFEITVCFAGSYAPSFTPMQIITSASPRRRGDDDPLGAALEVRGGLLARGEQAGRLDHDVDAVVAPRDLAPARALRAS